MDARFGDASTVFRPRLTSALILFATVAVLGLASPGVASPPPAGAADSALGKLPLSFIENRGQVDARADYYLPGKDTSVFFTGDGLRMSLAGQGIIERRYDLGLDFVGARPDARPAGREKTPTKISYFKGARSDWKTGLSTYSKLVYRDLWPGIDLIYSGTGNRLKYSFLVKPGADPAAIQLAWQGATGTKLSRDGQLEVSTPAGVLRDEAPYSYQVIGGRRVKVESSYALAAGDRYGFRVGTHDKTRPLVIDPAMLVYAGFIGGSGNEQANNVALDDARNLYVVGVTSSPDFPATAGSFGRSFGGGDSDAFVAKVNPAGTGLVYASYIGGTGQDFAINLDVDSAGAAYVGGATRSTDASFPVTVGPDLTYNGGPLDSWVAKVRPNGSGLDYSGFIGGAGEGPPGAPNEQANGIIVDAAGSTYVTGFTGSSEATFPNGTGFGSLPGSVPGFDQTFNSVAPGVPDAYLVKVKADGSGFEYGTYIGGGGADAGTGLSVDGSGNAYVNVFTGSNEQPRGMTNPFGGFPVTAGSFDQSFNGPPGPAPADGAVVKLNTAVPGAGALVYGTYIGGAGAEQPFGNVLDSSGNLYLTGRTESDHSTFPNGNGFGALATPGFDQTFNGGAEDAFVAKLNAAGSGLQYATYIGGAGADQAVGIGLDPRRSAYIFGTTSSTQASFPVRDGPDSTYNGGETDAFAAKLNPAGTAPDYAGYIGGSSGEAGIGMTVDEAGNAYVAGATGGAGFPVKVGPDTTFNGTTDTDAFVAKIEEAPGGPPPPSPQAPFADCPTGTANVIRGAAGSESITGTPGADRIFAGTGNDVVDALAGDDCVDLGTGDDRGEGGLGDDLMIGGLGRDRIAGSSGNDRIRGNPGNDRIDAGRGNDRAFGDAGNDLIRGSFGNDVLHGVSGNDRLFGSRGRDRINGGSGRDSISAGSSSDRVAGDAGNDRINGNSGNDRIKGNSGNDRITGSTGRDRISGGSGRDRVNARDGRGGDRISCGIGRDSVVADRGDRVSRDCERVARRG